MATIPRSPSRNSMHGRQISVSSSVSGTRANGSISNGNTNATAGSSSSSRPASGSHHRRRSSVSSRRESREMMGINIDDSSEDHHPPIGSNGVDQRQRALWALEGKKPSSPVFLGFQKVELPEWHTPSDERDGFNWSPTSTSSPSSSLSLGSSSSIKHHSLTSITPMNAGVGGNAFNFSLTNSLANKRDSFGKNLISASSSLKAELHTLLEEDEEEEEDEDDSKEADNTPSVGESKPESPVYVQEPESMEDATGDDKDDTPVQHYAPVSPVTTVPETSPQPAPRVITLSPSRSLPTMCSPSRSKPALRPLSLVAAHHQPIATPTISPSPRLKSLTLATILPLQNHNQQNTNTNSNVTTMPSITMNAGRRNSSSPLAMNGAVAPLTPSPSPNYNNTTTTERQLRRRSSIGYRRGSSSSSLSNPKTNDITTPSRRSSKRQSIPITPSLNPSSVTRSITPTTPSDSYSSSRASSEFFHTQAVSSLLGRIASLEEALQTAATTPAVSKHGSFPLTPQSSHESSPLADRMSPCNHEPVDELISCIADLKSERDELTNDISGWRTRCNDLERSCDVFGRRLAEERKELWLLQDRITVLEAEVQGERLLRTKLEADMTAEKTTTDVERQTKMALEKSINEERAEWVREEMSFEGQRLKWAKERRGWEMERELQAGERRLVEDMVARKDAMIKTLERKLQEAERMRTNYSDTSLTPKAKGPWNGATTSTATVSSKGFAFPPLSPFHTPNSDGQEIEHVPQSPSVAESPSQPSSPSAPFTPKQGPGSLNTGFKFGGGMPKSAFSPCTPEAVKTPMSSVQRPKVSSPTSDKGFALDAVVEEEEDVEEEEEDCLQNYEDEEDGDASFSCHGSDDLSSSDDQHTNGNATYTVPALDMTDVSPAAPTVPQQTHPNPAMTPIPQQQQQPVHSHRRSVSTIQKWRFPSTMSRRENNGLNAKPVDPFFACLESEEENAMRRIGVVGKQMKVKEHKKLPSGCPAFWLDCDDTETVLVSSALPLPSPATTEEEDNISEFTINTPAATTDSECDVQDLPPRKSDSSTPPMPFPIVARPVADSTSSTIQSPAPAVAPISWTAASRVSLARPPQAAPPNRSRVVPAPTFIPPQSNGVGSPVRSLVRSLPPTASPVMVVPPTVHVGGIGSPGTSPDSVTRVIPGSYNTAPPTINIASPTFPVAFIAPAVSFTSRFQTLSNMILWPTKVSPPAPSARCSILTLEDDSDSSTTVTQQHTPNASFASSSSSSPAKSMATGKSSSVKPKLVDPSVMRERLRAQLEKDGKLGIGLVSSVGLTETRPCGNCYATNVVEL
ncbi:hypothetical protein FRB98_002707 [Tulasnella sp. 332]|nr:hypothetical protein FRB98_002707 [Tulasnella sp. 332]